MEEENCPPFDFFEPLSDDEMRQYQAYHKKRIEYHQRKMEKHQRPLEHSLLVIKTKTDFLDDYDGDERYDNLIASIKEKLVSEFPNQDENGRAIMPDYKAEHKERYPELYPPPEPIFDDDDRSHNSDNDRSHNSDNY